VWEAHGELVATEIATSTTTIQHLSNTKQFLGLKLPACLTNTAPLQKFSMYASLFGRYTQAEKAFASIDLGLTLKMAMYRLFRKTPVTKIIQIHYIIL
jgi:hypothetical protein